MATSFVLSPPLLRFIIVTRVALGVGIGLLLADQFPRERRRKIGMALAAFGAATTIPAITSVLRNRVTAGGSN